MSTTKLAKSLNKLALMSAASIVLAAPLGYAQSNDDEHLGVDETGQRNAPEERELDEDNGRSGAAGEPILGEPGTMSEETEGQKEYREIGEESDDVETSSDSQYESDDSAATGAAGSTDTEQHDDMSYDAQNTEDRMSQQDQDSAAMQESEMQDSEVQQQSEQSSMVNIGAGESMSADELVDRDVVNLAGEEIGSVQDVVRSQTGDETALVVGSGGFMGFGGNEVLISVDEVSIGQDDQIVWESNASSDQLEEQPEYNEDNYVSIR